MYANQPPFSGGGGPGGFNPTGAQLGGGYAPNNAQSNDDRFGGKASKDPILVLTRCGSLMISLPLIF